MPAVDKIIDRLKTEKLPGIRSILKLCMGSKWGGSFTDEDATEIVAVAMKRIEELYLEGSSPAVTATPKSSSPTPVKPSRPGASIPASSILDQMDEYFKDKMGVTLQELIDSRTGTGDDDDED